MNWEPDPDLGEPVEGVSLERSRLTGEIYDYRVVVREAGTPHIAVVAHSRDGRESIGMAYHAAVQTAGLLRVILKKPEAKLWPLALLFVARQGLLEKFSKYLKCSHANAKAEDDVRAWLKKQAEESAD